MFHVKQFYTKNFKSVGFMRKVTFYKNTMFYAFTINF